MFNHWIFLRNARVSWPSSHLIHSFRIQSYCQPPIWIRDIVCPIWQEVHDENERRFCQYWSGYTDWNTSSSSQFWNILPHLSIYFCNGPKSCDLFHLLSDFRRRELYAEGISYYLTQTSLLCRLILQLTFLSLLSAYRKPTFCFWWFIVQ